MKGWLFSNLNFWSLCFKACMQESFRLSPPLSLNGRVVPEDIVLDGYKIPANTACWHFPSIFANDQAQFANTDQFMPERWLDSAKKDIHPLAVRPFSRGPRMCIGKRFAELELQIATHRQVDHTWLFSVECTNFSET